MRSSAGCRTIVFMILAAAGLPQGTRAQEAGAAPAPCRARACALVVDWGPGKNAGTYPTDRKYGSGDDFESTLKFTFAAHGWRTLPTAEGTLTITARPTMRPRAMCDAMAGTNTDYSCTAMAEVAISFKSDDPEQKAPGAMRITNRCGARDVYMTMPVFAKFASDMVYWSMEGEAKKEKRPSSSC